MLMSKKKIILFTPGPMGGAEKIVAQGMTSLQNQGEAVELWVIKESRAATHSKAFLDTLSSSIEIKGFECRSIFDFKLILSLKKSLHEKSPLILHTHGFKAAFYGFLAKSRLTRLIHTHHGKTAHTLKVRLYEALETMIMKRISGVIAVSSEMKISLVKSGIPENKIQVIENFLTIPLQHKKNLSSPLKLLFVGRLSPEKGCNILIEALKHFPQEKFHVSILGDGTERNELENLARGMNISFLGFQKEVGLHMAEHDVLVMPSFREGQPLALIEAVCMGLPVVASHVGGIPDLVQNNKNGHLFRPGEASELIEILTKLEMTFPKIKKEAEERASAFKTKFSASMWAQNTTDFYQRVLSQE